MPRFDRSGPWGQGPRTGSGFGLCGRGGQTRDDSIVPEATGINPRRINRRAQKQANRRGGGFLETNQRGGQGGGRRGGQRRSRSGRCWTTGGRFSPTQFKPNQAD